MTRRQKGPDEDDSNRQKIVDLGSFIREQRRLAELSVRKLSERAGISNPYLSQIERGLRKPSADILQQIAVALEISAESLYTRAGILDENTGGRPDVVMAIRSDGALSERDKQVLIHLFRSLSSQPADQPDQEDDPPAAP